MHARENMLTRPIASAGGAPAPTASINARKHPGATPQGRIFIQSVLDLRLNWGINVVTHWWW
jgi:hypothetical protein